MLQLTCAPFAPSTRTSSAGASRTCRPRCPPLTNASASVAASASITVGTVAAFLQLVRRFYQPLQDLSDKYNTLQQAMASSERVFRLLDTEGGATGLAASPPSLFLSPASRSVTVTFDDDKRAVFVLSFLCVVSDSCSLNKEGIARLTS